MTTMRNPDPSCTTRWLAASRRGDASAVQSAFDAHGVSMFRFACLALDDTAVAEEIVHELFLDLYRRRKRTPRKAGLGYLYAELGRRCLLHLDQDWVQRAEASTTGRAGKTVLGRLAPRSRVAFLLHRAGQPADVIAEALSTRSGRVLALIRDAVEALRGPVTGFGRPAAVPAPAPEEHPRPSALAPAPH